MGDRESSMGGELVMLGNVYRDKRVLLTGHTGFKGSWLAYWLQRLGAEVCGYALTAPTNPSHWDLLNLDMRSELGDIRDADNLKRIVSEFKPEVVFHMAAQPLVRRSYGNPDETFETNVMGTVRLLDACRSCDSVRAIVNITSDKCYDNKEWVWGYREDDPMGGYDPYSASKGCSELIASSYRQSFFNTNTYGTDHQVLLSSCRAGNVIGGGDWAEDRLIPDIMRSIDTDCVVRIRNPSAIRPWQHVLEPLSGYLQVGQKLLQGDKSAATAWNFGPNDADAVCVESVVKYIQEFWPKVRYQFGNDGGPHEANLLKLDISKARQQLGWCPVWTARECFERTVGWYRTFSNRSQLETEADLNQYIADAVVKEISWTK